MQSTTGTTADESVPTPFGRSGRHATWPGWLALAALLLVSAFLLFATKVDLAYYAISPGSAVDLTSRVIVDDEHRHDAEGGFLLMTVGLGKVTLLEALAGWLDPAVDVVRERVIIGDQDIDQDELRQLNLQLMDESKQKALGVAFEALGVDAIKGTGAEIVGIVPDTPAAELLAAGDTIVGVGDAVVAVDHDAVREIGERAPGDSLTLAIESAAGERRDVTVTLAEHPEEPGRPFLGVVFSTRDLTFDFPFEVELRSEDIGGPSGGLAFTLEIIDVLTEGELTGGRLVAATGTIELDGSVGVVGGVAQKTEAVNQSGAELFLVPPGEAEEARRFADDDLDVVEVGTLGEALAALAEVGGNGLALPDLDGGGAA